MSFIEELKRRNVVRVGVAYVVGAWLLMQFTDVLIQLMELSPGIGKIVVLILMIGFPLALFFAWAFELTPEGIKRDHEVDRTESIAPQTAKKLDRLIIAILMVVVAWFVFDEFYLEPGEVTTSTDSEQAQVVAPTQKSVAVLPFRSMSSGEDDEYFADGLTEEILNSLAAVQDLLVTARTSSFHFKGQDLPVTEIGKTLGVDHIVEGSVRRSNENVRITAQLVRSEDGFHLWSQTYDRTLEDVFAVQEDIAASIAAALDVLLDDAQVARMREAGIGNVEAFIAYQKGNEAMAQAHVSDDIYGGLAEANLWYDRALELVPDLTVALMMRIDYYHHFLSDDAFDRLQADPEALIDAKAEILESLNLAIQSAKTEEVRAVIEAELLILSDDWSNLPEKFRQAFGQGNCVPNIWLDTLAAVLGATEEVIQHTRAVDRCDPLDQTTISVGAAAETWAGRPEAALAWAEEKLALHGFSNLYENVRFHALMAMDAGEDDPDFFKPDSGEYWAVPRPIIAYAQVGDLDTSNRLYEEFAANAEVDRSDALIVAAVHGNRVEANRLASLIDSRPGHAIALLTITTNCMCGAPFDLDATPNLKKKLEAAGVPWPPPSPIKFPAKDW